MAEFARLAATGTMNVGDWVVYRLTKHSNSPGRRAKNVRPEGSGEGYAYQVDKYWLVTAVECDAIEVATRRGKRRLVAPDDQLLRRARWWERWFLARRFPRVDSDEFAAD